MGEILAEVAELKNSLLWKSSHGILPIIISLPFNTLIKLSLIYCIIIITCTNVLHERKLENSEP